jgi:GNAT superfamily N-acetyltransferase
VAEHRDQGIVGTLLAYPPTNVVSDHLTRTKHAKTDPRAHDKLLLSGATLLSKIKALAVTETARRHGIGAALLKRCTQIYFHSGYHLIYGMMPPTPGLDSFYRRRGFSVMDPGAPIDLWVIFGIHSHITPGADERYFLRESPRLSSARA